jgi:hypothetical protein
MNGRFFELSPQNEIVWEYINPVNPNGGPLSQGGTLRFNQTFRATKYPVDFPAFEGRNLAPGAPIEINPRESECYTPAPDSFEKLTADRIRIHGNPVGDVLVLESLMERQEVGMWVVDLHGHRLLNATLFPGMNAVDVSGISAGIYFLRFEGEQGEGFGRKVVKP